MRHRRPVVVALVLPLVLAAAALHNHLDRAQPAVKSEITASPKEIRLWFTEPVDAGISTITLMTGDSVPVPSVGKVTATDDPKSFRAPVTATLKPGKYIVRYKTSGADGHVVRGRYSFTLK